MAWRPQSTSDEAAEVAAWVGRTEEIRVRAATVIPRAWEIQPGAQEFQEYRNWVMAETQACMNAALSALGKAAYRRACSPMRPRRSRYRTDRDESADQGY